MSTNKQMGKIGEIFNKYRELISYLFFGVLTTAVNFLIFALISELGLIKGDFSEAIANTIAWFFAVLFAFFTNKYLVFEHKNNSPLFREFLTFFGARVLSGVIENGGMALFADILEFNKWIVKIILAVFVVIFNYVLSKFLIFKK